MTASKPTVTAKPIQVADIPGWETAPVINFELASAWGIHANGGRITLQTVVLVPQTDGTTRPQHVVIAHLQGSGPAFVSLSVALDDMARMAAPAKPNEPVN